MPIGMVLAAADWWARGVAAAGLAVGLLNAGFGVWAWRQLNRERVGVRSKIEVTNGRRVLRVYVTNKRQRPIILKGLVRAESEPRPPRWFNKEPMPAEIFKDLGEVKIWPKATHVCDPVPVPTALEPRPNRRGVVKWHVAVVTEDDWHRERRRHVDPSA